MYDRCIASSYIFRAKSAIDLILLSSIGPRSRSFMGLRASNSFRHTQSHRATRRTWLILPVVICLFQGLSHANVRVLVLRHRGVCVRLIKRFMVYPTKEGLVPFLRDNCANRAANTWKKIPWPLHQKAGKLVLLGSRKLLAETKTDAFTGSYNCWRRPTKQKRIIFWYAWLDEFTTYQVEGSVVDYLAFDG